MRKVAIFGGSFDPIHNGHLEVAKHVCKKLSLDEVWFTPTCKTPLKERNLTSFSLRSKMIKEAIKPYHKFKYCNVEERLPTPNYTYQTVLELKRRHNDIQFFWIIGDDQYIQLDRWKNIENLKKEVQMICVHRDENELKKDKSILFVKDINRVESSTKVREGNFNLIPKKVRKIVLENKLYLDDVCKNRLSEKRYEHSVSVAKLCIELALAHGVDTDKAYICGLLHDITKEIKFDKAKKYMKNYYPEHLDDSHKIWHQWTAVVVLKNELGIEDKEVLNAIGSHTTGYCKSKLAKILYIADKIDPLRGYNTDYQLKLCMLNLDIGFKYIQDEQKGYLKKMEEHHD